jgi:hypothetical protein
MNSKSKPIQSKDEITILFERILTLEITLSAIFDELVETNVIDSDKVNDKIQNNLAILNKQVQELNSISKKMNTMNMFMGNDIGEA